MGKCSNILMIHLFKLNFDHKGVRVGEKWMIYLRTYLKNMKFLEQKIFAAKKQVELGLNIYQCFFFL